MPSRRALLACGAMLSVSALAEVRMPSKKLAAGMPPVDFNALVPRAFADWRVDTSLAPLLPSPEIEAQLKLLYSQTLARTYVHDDGRRIMFVTAYGDDQSDSVHQMHLPEVCYAAQGFEVQRRGQALINARSASVPVIRLFARQGRREEPISYWSLVQDRLLLSETARKIARARYALAGEIPDGILVRVSSIDSNEQRAFASHDGFVADLFGAMPADDRRRIFGRLA